ncbi:formyltransferase family protein [Kribbella sp. NPDC051770]|uniref:methionyl-tRNA formyltransferase n=1 Tax=Kribbella sp. NPDC051770 TaxID=3155413 RepID=UPI00344604DB
MLRIVTLNTFQAGYRVVSEWAARNGHEIVLLVTLPVGGERYDPTAPPLIASMPAELNVLVTNKLRAVAAPVIEAMEPDLVISAAFPRLIPDEVLKVPRYGALNCHPSPLPIGRGPNPQRLIYEGSDEVAASVHRTEPGFDTGAVLAQRSMPLPADLNGGPLMECWRTLLTSCLDEAVPRAVAGDRGEPQDPAKVTEAPRFTPEEYVLDLTEPSAVVRRKAAALNITAVMARVRLDGTEYLVARTEPTEARAGAPGSIVATHHDGFTVRTADAALRLTAAQV